DPVEQAFTNQLLAPSRAHLFGTDEFGRDIFSRVIYGARIALVVGVVADGIAALLGVIAGGISGYFGRGVDGVIMRAVDGGVAGPGSAAGAAWPEGGALLATGRSFLLTGPWIAPCPAVAILVTVVRFDLVGDGLRDLLDPRLRGAR